MNNTNDLVRFNSSEKANCLSDFCPDGAWTSIKITAITALHQVFQLFGKMGKNLFPDPLKNAAQVPEIRVMATKKPDGDGVAILMSNSSSILTHVKEQAGSDLPAPQPETADRRVSITVTNLPDSETGYMVESYCVLRNEMGIGSPALNFNALKNSEVEDSIINFTNNVWKGIKEHPILGCDKAPYEQHESVEKRLKEAPNGEFFPNEFTRVHISRFTYKYKYTKMNFNLPGDSIALIILKPKPPRP